MNPRLFIAIVTLLIILTTSIPEEDLTNDIKSLIAERQLKGMQLVVSKSKQIVYNLNLGEKNEAK